MSRVRLARIALVFLLATMIWLPCVHRIYAVDDDARTAIRTSLAAQQIDAWARPAAERDDLRRMRGVNPEWDFMSRTYTTLALADLALAGDDPERARMLVTIDAILDDTLRLEESRGDLHFLLPYAQRGPFLDPEGRSVFVDGEILMMIAARELVAPRPELASDAKTRAARIVRAMQRSPSMSAESYPDECWTFCNTTALAALAMLDRSGLVPGVDHASIGRAWIDHARAHLVDRRTGILISSYTYGGRTLDGPEGSSIWMSAQNLLFVDEAFAREQYALARRELGVTFLGFGWAREWPKGVPQHPDVDSGPIVPLLDASAGASGLALLGATAFDDRPFRDGLLASLELAAFPEQSARGRRYQASNAVGDAVVLRALSTGPLLARMRERRVSSGGEGVR